MFDTFEERYRAFIEQSSEGIWLVELDQPVLTDTPPDEQVALFFKHAFLAECNEAMVRMYGFSNRNELIGCRLGELLAIE